MVQKKNKKKEPISYSLNISDSPVNAGAFSIAPQDLIISQTSSEASSISIANNVVPAPAPAPQPSAKQAKANDAPKRGDRYKRPAMMISAEIGPDASQGNCSLQFNDLPSQMAVDGIRFDFAFGFRVMIPEDAKCDYNIRIFDMDSGLQLEEHTLKPGNILVGDRKFFIPYRIEIRKNNELVFTHNYDCTGKKVNIVVPDGGLGDNLAWVPLAEAFRELKHADVSCVCGEWMIKLVADLYPGMTFIPMAGKPKMAGAYANYFCGIFDENMDHWRPILHQHLGMQGAVEAILNLPQEPHKCRLHLGSKRPFPERYVCVSTQGTNPDKCWNFPDGWNIIIRQLREYGYRVLDIDRDATVFYGQNPYKIPTEAEDFTGRFSLQERINLLEHADFFIGLPSGLSWLAWNCNIPVLMIAGFTLPVSEFPTPYRVTNHLFCHGCWNDTHCFFDRNVPIWCPKHLGTPREIECTKTITPKMVWETICKIPQFQEQRSMLNK